MFVDSNSAFDWFDMNARLDRGSVRTTLRCSLARAGRRERLAQRIRAEGLDAFVALTVKM